MSKIDYEKTAIPVGNPTFGGYTYIFAGHYNGLLFSQNNHKLRNGSWSGGGGFYVVKSSVTHQGQIAMPVSITGFPLGTWLVQGNTGCPGMDSISGPAVPDWTASATDVQKYIPEGYRKTRPGNPKASLGQFLIELRDFPKIPFSGGIIKRSRRANKYGFKTIQVSRFQDIPRELFKNLNSFRNLGSEYLNVVFGWKPFINDLRKMYSLWGSIDKQMAQIIRENGKGIDRRATVDESTSISVSDPVVYPYTYANVYGGPPNFPSFDGYTVYTTLNKTQSRVWYMAKYQYYIPDVSSSQWNARARAALFGVLPTPELLWSVLPWSWLFDWFTNVGDIYSNISPNAVDDLVTRYSYTMKHTTTTSSYHSYVAHAAGDGVSWVHPACHQKFSSFYKVETKLRFPGGSPYTLHVEGADFSPYQLGVLAALGLSKSGSPIR